MKKIFEGFLYAGALALVGSLFGCSGQDTQRTDPTDLAMTNTVAPFYNDGELVLYETQHEDDLPIRKPTPAEQKSLDGAIGPFSHHPWVQASDVSVQMTWTVANLDGAAHTVKILVDPWNEFGKYVPGVTIDGDNAVPNLSGIDMAVDLQSVKSGDASRASGTFSYDDMHELATDFATAINIIKTAKPTAMDGVMDDPRVGLVNHVFALQNRSGRDPLTDPYIPPVIPALVGFDLGLRTTEPANVAIEYTLEITDNAGNRTVDTTTVTTTDTLKAPNQVYTVGGTN